jgi:ABC-type spermidine/putrescine transport system permease subunit II
VAILIAPLLVIGILAFSESRTLVYPPPAYSLANFEAFFGSSAWMTSLQHSFIVSCGAAAIDVVLAIPLALALTRGRIGRSNTFKAFILAPMIIPVVSISVAFYFVAVKYGLVGSLWGLVVADATVGLPVTVLAIYAAFRQIEDDLEAAAMTLGASRVRAFFGVSLPLVLPGIIVGFMFAFLLAWEDITNVLFIGSATTATFPLRLWNELNYAATPMIATAASSVSVLGLMVMLFGYVLMRLLARRNVGRSGVDEILGTTGMRS